MKEVQEFQKNNKLISHHLEDFYLNKQLQNYTGFLNRDILTDKELVKRLIDTWTNQYFFCFGYTKNQEPFQLELIKNEFEILSEIYERGLISRIYYPNFDALNLHKVNGQKYYFSCIKYGEEKWLKGAVTGEEKIQFCANYINAETKGQRDDESRKNMNFSVSNASICLNGIETIAPEFKPKSAAIELNILNPYFMYCVSNLNDRRVGLWLGELDKNFALRSVSLKEFSQLTELLLAVNPDHPASRSTISECSVCLEEVKNIIKNNLARSESIALGPCMVAEQKYQELSFTKKQIEALKAFLEKQGAQGKQLSAKLLLNKNEQPICNAALIIYDIKKFINRIEKSFHLKFKAAFSGRHKSIFYYNKNSIPTQIHDPFFSKENSYAWQWEHRFIVTPDKIFEPEIPDKLFLNLGPLDGIARYEPIAYTKEEIQFFKDFKEHSHNLLCAF